MATAVVVIVICVLVSLAVPPVPGVPAAILRRRWLRISRSGKGESAGISHTCLLYLFHSLIRMRFSGGLMDVACRHCMAESL